MEVAITKMSSKGQIVIPASMRKRFNKGQKLLILDNKKQLVLKKASDLDEDLKEDIDFARRTEKAWKKYEKGDFKSKNSKDFLKELDDW